MKDNEKLIYLRKRFGLPKWLIADMLHISGRKYGKLENGKLLIDQTILIDICNLYKLTINEFISLESDNDYIEKSELIDYYIENKLVNNQTIYDLLYNIL